MSAKPRRTASMKMSEDIENTCEAAWGSTIANVTDTADPTIFKVGTKSCKCVIAAGFTTGAIVWDITSGLALDIATEGYTHVKLWVYTTVALAAGDIKFALDSAVDFSTAAGANHAPVDVPAVSTINTWHRVIVPLSTTQKAMTSVDSIGFETALADLTARTIYFDDIRLCRYTAGGDSAITLPTAAITNTENVWLMPFHCDLASFGELPQDCDVQYTLSMVPGTWDGSTEVNGAIENFLVGDRPTDLFRQFGCLKFTLGDDLAAGEYISVVAREA